MAAAEVRHVNTLASEARSRNRPPDRCGVDLDLVREAAEIVRIGEWDVLAEQGPL